MYHIVFTKNYNQEIFENISTNMTNEQIKKVLGEPTFLDEENKIIGYKNEEFYVFFCEGEVSIYRNEKEYDTMEFAKILTEYNNTEDHNTFILKLTEFWPDYDRFYKVSNRVMLQYTLKGLIIDLNAMQNNGITIYSNYQGQLTEDLSIKDIKSQNRIVKNVYTELNTNLVFKNEQERVLTDKILRNPVDPLEELNTEEYSVSCNTDYNGRYSDITFYSTNKNNIDIELREKIVNQFYRIDNFNYVYSIKNKGIYIFNIKNKEYKTIVSGVEEFNINKIENNIIYYDNTNISI